MEICSDQDHWACHCVVAPPHYHHEGLMAMLSGYGADQIVESQVAYSVYTIYIFSFFVHTQRAFELRTMAPTTQITYAYIYI